MAAEAANGKVLPNCYSIGSNTNAHVTFASQQRRCLNLAWALKQRDRLDGNSFAIVGAGIAGVTLAVALRKLGAESVDLFDAYEEPATPQRASTQRFIHPNLFDWPTEGWDEANANLPVVNWLASRASKVRAQVFAGFVVEAFQARQIKLLPQRYVVDLKADPTSVRIESMPFSEMVSLQNHPLADKPDVSMMVPTEVRNYSSAVLCEGFLPEKRWEGALSGSYWRDSRPRWRTGSDVEIVGDGDGAITELFEASFQAVSPTSSSSRWHQEQLEDIARLVPAAERIAILDLEDELRRDSSNRDALTELPPMSPSITRLLSRVPYRTRVRLVGRSRERMLRPTSFVLNRVVASVLNNVSSAVEIDGPNYSPIHSPIEAKRDWPGAEIVWRVGASMPADFGLRRLAEPTLRVREIAGNQPKVDNDLDFLLLDVLGFGSEPAYSDNTFGNPSAKVANATFLRSKLEDMCLRESQLGSSPGSWPIPDPPDQLEHQRRTGTDQIIFDISDALVRFIKVVGARPFWWADEIDGRVWLSLDFVALACDLPPVTVATRFVRSQHHSLLRRRFRMAHYAPQAHIASERVWIRERLGSDLGRRRVSLPEEEIGDLGAMINCPGSPDTVVHWSGSPPVPTDLGAGKAIKTGTSFNFEPSLLADLAEVGFERPEVFAEGLLRNPNRDAKFMVSVLEAASDEIFLAIIGSSATSQTSQSVRPSLACLAKRLATEDRTEESDETTVAEWAFANFQIGSWFEFPDPRWTPLLVLGLASASLGRLECVRPNSMDESTPKYLDEDSASLKLSAQILEGATPFLKGEIEDASGKALWEAMNSRFSSWRETHSNGPRSPLELFDMNFLGLRFVDPIKEPRAEGALILA